MVVSGGSGEDEVEVVERGWLWLEKVNQFLG